jgi:hypothetical protein
VRYTGGNVGWHDVAYTDEVTVKVLGGSVVREQDVLVVEL